MDTEEKEVLDDAEPEVAETEEEETEDEDE